MRVDNDEHHHEILEEVQVDKEEEPEVDHLVAGVCVSVCQSVKRGLFTWQKRPIYMAKEACLRSGSSRSWRVRKCVPKCQKRPVYVAKEACLHGTRGLFV